MADQARRVCWRAFLKGDAAHDDLGPEDLVGLLKKPAGNQTTIQKKPAAKNQPASKKQAAGKKQPMPTKPVESLKKKHGWIVERRYRTDGQVDVHYRSPKGPVYRTLKEARANGYRDWHLSGKQKKDEVR